MKNLLNTIKSLWTVESVRKKILYTIGLIILYRFFVFVPVPFINVDILMQQTQQAVSGWLGFFVMLLWGTLSRFSIIAVWLTPFINASIIMQLLTVVVPKFEQLQELWEQWTKQIQQYMRYLTFPLAFLQSIWMVYLINTMIPWVVDVNNFGVVLFSAFVMSVWSMIVLLIWDYITEKGITNWVSLLIFASIVSWIVTKFSQWMVGKIGNEDVLMIILFIFVMVGLLVAFSIFLLKSIKHIPIVYARQWKIEQTSSLPIPLNPVWMIPIIFAIAFATFPYLLSQIIIKFWTTNQTLRAIADWVDVNMNIYSSTSPSWFAIIVYFILIIVFTFFYTLIQFNPDKIADSIQKRWGYIPWIRPWEETAKYINKVLMHLCLWWWTWLAILGVYTYLINKIPVFAAIGQAIWGIPVVVTWSGIIIIVWVVQDLLSKAQTEILMHKYNNL